ncbi:MAG: NAD-dependent epimerase/dehydratase family protein [Steroidobacteraceae bacterium]
MSRVLVTGATGFIGTPLCERLAQSGHVVRAAVRAERPVPPYIAETVVTSDIGAATDWGAALRGVDLVVHAAARVHVLRPEASAEGLYMETNARGTERLAQAAVAAGVRRFVYLSSIKVNGEDSAQRAYRADDVPDPRDAYARSKLEGERLLRQAAAASTMEAVIVRPPLVYGTGVRANFLRLMRWVDRRWPLPFASIHNQRSLLSVWNLSDLIATLLVSHRPASGVWLVSDGEDLATAELLRRLGHALGRPVHLLPIPAALLRACGTLSGRGAELRRLCGSLTVSTEATRAAFSWSAPLGVDAGLARTAAWYRAQRH